MINHLYTYASFGSTEAFLKTVKIIAFAIAPAVIPRRKINKNRLNTNDQSNKNIQNKKNMLISVKDDVLPW